MNLLSHAPTSASVKVVRMPQLLQNSATEAALELSRQTIEKRKESLGHFDKIKQFQNKTKTRVQQSIEESERHKKQREQLIKENIYRTFAQTRRNQNNQIKSKLRKQRERTVYKLDRQIAEIYEGERQALQRLLNCCKTPKQVQLPKPESLIDSDYRTNQLFNNDNNNNNSQNNINSIQNDINVNNNSLAIVKSERSLNKTNNNTNNNQSNSSGDKVCSCFKPNKPFSERGIEDKNELLNENERRALFGAIKQWHLMQDRIKSKVNAI